MPGGDLHVNFNVAGANGFNGVDQGKTIDANSVASGNMKVERTVFGAPGEDNQKIYLTPEGAAAFDKYSDTGGYSKPSVGTDPHGFMSWFGDTIPRKEEAQGTPAQ